MPDSCSSIGAATVFASVSAFAPGYVAVIVTVGGAMSGYCAIGSVFNATSPASIRMIAITLAKIGRRMKNFDMSDPSVDVRVARDGDRHCFASPFDFAASAPPGFAPSAPAPGCAPDGAGAPAPGCVGVCPRGLGLRRMRRDRRAGAHLQEVVDDHAVARRSAPS